MLTAASPCRLNRATNLATVVLLPKPACRAAAANPCPWTTANPAVARRTRSTRSLLLRASRSNAACSAGVTARNGSFCGVAILALLRDSAVSSLDAHRATYLRLDPLAHASRAQMRTPAAQRLLRWLVAPPDRSTVDSTELTTPEWDELLCEAWRLGVAVQFHRRLLTEAPVRPIPRGVLQCIWLGAV